MTKDITFFTELVLYTEAKVDVTQEIEHRAQQASQAGADHCALCSISCVTSTLASVYCRTLYMVSGECQNSLA